MAGALRGGVGLGDRRTVMIRHVRLEAARCHEFPEGSQEHGYELALPLTADGRLDRESWLTHRDSVGFRRFWDGGEEQGVLKHARRGWTLSFAPGTDDDEVIFKGDAHRFAEGEYVSIKERDGVTRTFRVVTVR
jgi:hypothetical protein